MPVEHPQAFVVLYNKLLIMARPVRFNIVQKDTSDRGINQVMLPEGHMGEGFFATSLDKVVGLARKNSMWPLPFATSCCGIEFMATMGSHYDLSRFGSERVGFSPRQCDLLMVMGTIAKKKWLRFYVRFTSRWQNPGGLLLLEPVHPVVVYLIHILFCRASIR